MNRKNLVSTLALGLAAAACAPAVVIPDAIQPSIGSSLAMVVPARGTQIYECRIKKGDTVAYEWAFVAPDAQLLDARGNVIGNHGAGPFWQALDGSRIVGKVVARSDAPATGAIPWLLLSTTNSGPAGSFSRVTSIQRVNTVGGSAPAKSCTGELLGHQTGVPYTADYRFFVQLSQR